ncbi:MAG: hypothetical protein GY801_06590 [bacterium]|nr:hypothetical protein [bacterium]
MTCLFPENSAGYLFQDEKRGTNLSIFGLGMLRLNYATVDGDAPAFELSDDGYAEDFDTRGFVSFSTNGTLFHDYGLEGFIRYDEEDDPNLNFLFTLSRDENFLMFGDQPLALPENYFSRYSNPFRGLTLHLESEKVGLTTFGAVTRGETVKEEIQPDGTSGPYRLESVPVVPGSEIVSFEVRNRNDLKQVIEKIPQERNVDYVIDYDDGKITFAEPVDSDTFRGDPVFIVAIYRSEEESSEFSTSLAGGRVFAEPTDWLIVGAGFVSEFDRDPPISEAFDARQEIYSFDGALRLGETLMLRTEYAVSQDHQNPENDTQQAFLTTLNGTLGEKIDLRGRFHRNERDFLTFANPDVDPDEQELELIGRYAFLPNHNIELGYSMFQDNIPNDPEMPSVTTHRPYVGWDAGIREFTTLYSKYEFISNRDDLSPQETDDRSHIFLLGGTQEFVNVRALKTVRLRAEYQFDDFEDDTDQDDDTLTHHLSLRAQAEPWRDTAAYVEQKERLIRDKNLGEDTERQDISELGLTLGYWTRLSLKSKYQYRVDYDLLRDTRSAARHVLNVSADYQPFEVIKTYGRFEWRDETFWEQDVSDPDLLPDIDEALDDERSSQTMVIEGRLLYTPYPDLTFRARYEYDDTVDRDDLRTETMEDETEFRVNYAFDRRKTRLTGAVLIERDLLDAPPTPEAKTRTTTYLCSAARQLTQRWDAFAQYKREMVELSADNYREDILGELGYELGRFLKVAGGYQYSNYQDKQDTLSDYQAHSIYIRLIGKL